MVWSIEEKLKVVFTYNFENINYSINYINPISRDAWYLFLYSHINIALNVFKHCKIRFVDLLDYLVWQLKEGNWKNCLDLTLPNGDKWTWVQQLIVWSWPSACCCTLKLLNPSVYIHSLIHRHSIYIVFYNI